MKESRSRIEELKQDLPYLTTLVNLELDLFINGKDNDLTLTKELSDIIKKNIVKDPKQLSLADPINYSLFNAIIKNSDKSKKWELSSEYVLALNLFYLELSSIETLSKERFEIIRSVIHDSIKYLRLTKRPLKRYVA